MSPDLEAALRYCPNLPTLPGVAIRVLEASRNPDVTIGALAGVLAKDPALSSRMLRVCNSPIYAQRRTTTNLHQAVMLLGLNSTISLALSFALADVFRSTNGRNRQAILQRVWKRALISAIASRVLGERLALGSLDEIYLAALLQDLGILALYTALPDRYLPLLERFESHDDFVALERAQLGFDHGEAGTWLMRHWGVPERLAMTAAAVHQPQHPDLDAEQRSFVHTIAAAGQLADLIQSGGEEARVDSAARAANSLLGLGHEVFETVLEEVLGALPELGALFETQLASPEMAAGLVDQAREIMAARNLRLIHQAAEHHQQVIEMEQAAELLQKAAIHDALTGLHNRRHFDQVLDFEFALAIDNAWPLTLGFIDLDHFKAVNDSHGHVVGDSVLVKIAAVLKKNLRERDYIMRYGGEEFVVLLPGHGLEAALRVFERLRAAVEETMHMGDSGTRFKITTSIGLACHMDGEHRFEDPIDLVRAADRSLYDAKRSGRNRILASD